LTDKSQTVQGFAVRHPFLFALLFFATSACWGLGLHFLLPALTTARGANLVDLIAQLMLAIGVLVWLGWLQTAGFNAPSAWRSRVAWPWNFGV
jgi:hypothetical protein